MISRFRFTYGLDPVWGKVVGISLALFFVYLSDAIFSYWVPVTAERTLGGSLVMGLVVSFSSIAGFIADIVIPQLLKGTSVKRLIAYAIVANLMFGGLLAVTTLRPWVAVWLTAMAVWGVYYDLLGFANQQFVAETASVEQRPGAWAVMRVFSALAYLLGPIVASALIFKGDMVVVGVAAMITVTGSVIFASLKMQQKVVDIPMEEINLFRELEHWWKLLRHVWPIIVVSLMLGFVDATFWTVGAVWSEHLLEKSWLGSLFLPMYTLPSLFMGFVVMKSGIYKGKKRKGIKFMIISGIILIGIALNQNIFWQLGVVLVSSCLLSVTYPLIDAVYSDILARMGSERKHLIGLGDSALNLAYVGGPIIAGFLAQFAGERLTFGIVGAMTAVAGSLLLMLTPRKIKLPQSEIKSWQNVTT